MWAQNRPTALWHPAEGLRGKACELWTGRGQDLELALVHNDIDSHWARIPGCTATCVWCASVLFDVPKRHVPQNVHRCYHGMRAARQRPGNARPRPHSTPGTRARPVPALPGRWRGAQGGASAAPPDQMHPPGHPGAHMCSPRPASLFGSPAQPSPQKSVSGGAALVPPKQRFVDGRFHGGAPALAVEAFDSPEVRLVLGGPPPVLAA